MQHPIYTKRNKLLDKAHSVYMRTADFPNMPNFIFVMKRFEKTTWKLVQHYTKAPDGLTELERAFFNLFKLGVRPPTSVSGLYAALKDRNKNSGENYGN